jgi:hypothetical protein
MMEKAMVTVACTVIVTQTKSLGIQKFKMETMATFVFVKDCFEIRSNGMVGILSTLFWG